MRFSSRANKCFLTIIGLARRMSQGNRNQWNVPFSLSYRLTNCCLSADDCEAFTWVLNSNNKLKLLNVSYNYLDKGVPLLCKALRHPDCALEVLV